MTGHSARDAGDSRRLLSLVHRLLNNNELETFAPADSDNDMEDLYEALDAGRGDCFTD
jgi:hypothetical protein